MKKTPLFLAVAVAALTIISCKKEEEQATSSPRSSAAAATLAKPALLTSGNWRQTGLTVSILPEGSGQTATSDLFPRAKPAMLVQSVAYKADGTYTLVRGAHSDGKVAEPVTGSWALNTAADSLVVTENDQKRSFGLAELTTNTLRLTYPAPAVNGKTALCVCTATFSR